MVDPFAPIGGKSPRRAPPKSEWKVVTPVPTEAIAARPDHPKLGKATVEWAYANGEGEILGYVRRYDQGGGEKEFRPLCLFENDKGERQWRWESWPEPRPLFGLDRLAAAPIDATVLVCEGEKSAVAAGQLAGLVAVTSPAGAKSAAKANWQPLAGREVVIWPDADAAGLAYAQTAAKLIKLAGARSVAMISPPDGVSTGWDGADAAAEGWTAQRVLELVAAAGPIEGGKTDTAGRAELAGGRRGPRQRDKLITAGDKAAYWHSPQKVGYATVPVNSHHENYKIASEAFRRWLAMRYYEATGEAPAGQMLADALRVLEMKAIETGPEYAPAMRTAWHEGASWLDLCDSKWRAVRISAAGWSIVEAPPVKFIRTETMAALPEPEPGYLLEQVFRSFINAEEEDYRLLVAWCLAALWGRATSFPVLALGGEQGSGKSTMAKLLQALADPSEVAGMSLPKDDRDLFTMAMSGHVLSFDNVSKVDAWFSDAVCRLATGAGYLTRKLHSDGDPFHFKGSRPVILNGIPSLTDRADLAERALTVRLLHIDETTRQAEDDWQADWDTARPKILGALLDALSAVVRNYDQVKLKGMPRMAAFAKLMAAAEEALGWDKGTFRRAYDENRQATTEAVFESDFIALAIFKFMQSGPVYDGIWEGDATTLLAELNVITSEDIRRLRSWPTKPNAFGNALDRATPALRHKGIDVTKRRRGTTRLITLTIRAAVAGNPATPSDSETAH